MREIHTRLGKFFFAALFLSFAALLLGCGSASAQGRTYQITEEELTLLEENLSELSSVNEGQREQLMSLQEKLTASETRLEASERTSRMLGVKLDWLSKELTEQAASLENANLLLKEYEEEARRTKRRVERQRNMAYILAAIAVFFVRRSKRTGFVGMVCSLKARFCLSCRIMV